MENSSRLYYSISEVCKLTDIKPHVLRYWETEFKALRPQKNSAGNRTYRVKDIKLIYTIKHLLYNECYTIKGAKRKLAEMKLKDSAQIDSSFDEIKAKELLFELKTDLDDLVFLVEGE